MSMEGYEEINYFQGIAICVNQKRNAAGSLILISEEINSFDFKH